MRIYKTLLFIIICTGMVASLAFVFPKDGIEIGHATLRYADADKLLYPPVEEKIDIHKEARALADANKIRIFIANKEENKYKARKMEIFAHPYAISLPQDNVEWLDTVFRAMEGASKHTVRVLHYGDSQIEEDRISSIIRYRFQGLFGGFGVGLLPPLQPVPSAAIAQRSYGNHSRYVVFANKNMHHEEGQYGPTGQMLTINGNYSTSFFPINLKATKENTKKYQTVSVLYGNNTSPLSISLESEDYADTITVADSMGGLHFATFKIPHIERKVTLNVNGACQLYGYVLDGNGTGVQVDNIPMRGCSGTIFTRVKSSTLTPYFNKYSTPLIIMQYGGNSVPYLKGEKSISSYCNSIARQIAYIKRLSPKSKIIFVGPSDMGTSIDGTMQTYPSLPNVVKGLKQSCLDNDVAYWDLYAAMGGYNSMLTWVNAIPALAGSDHVHFTNLGSETAANMLCDHFQVLYEFYKERNE